MKRAGVAIAEQAVWSLGSFVVSAIVGRSLGVEGFGYFSLALVSLYAVGSLINSLVVNPALVVGPRDFEDDLKRYGARLLVASAVIGMVAASGGGLVLVMTDIAAIQAVGAGLVLALPTMISWSARRLPYMSEQPGVAFVGSALYFMGAVGGLVAANSLRVLSVNTALMVLAGSSVVQTLVTLWIWKPSWKLIAVTTSDRRAMHEHWEFGRWFLAAEMSSWILNYGLVGLGASTIGVQAAAGYRSGQVMLRPFAVAFQGVRMSQLPRLARMSSEEGIRVLGRSVRDISLFLFGLAVTGWVVMIVFGERLMGLIFGPEFVQFGGLVAAMTGSMAVLSWAIAPSMALLAVGRPRDVFWGHFAAGAVALLIGVPVGMGLGLNGLVIAMWVAAVARTGVVMFAFRRRSRAPVGPKLDEFAE